MSDVHVPTTDKCAHLIFIKRFLGRWLVRKTFEKGGRPRHPTTYICVDQAPEIARGVVNQRQAFLLLVKIGCGTMPCSHFPNGWELACILCTK